jgi:hypothetical protein
MKLVLRRTATGKEDPELPLLQRISSLELQAPKNASEFNSMKSGLHGQIAAMKPLLKDTNKKRHAWAK